MENEVKLTKLAKCAGCGAKVGAGVLAQLLDGIKVHSDPNLLVGFDKSDDASVYRVSDELALVQTVDFFPPIADDPYLFGQIAATNALSDVYAMGGEPKLALNLMCVPKDMPGEAVHQMLRGGYDKVYEAGCLITGGHSIFDDEPKYGLAVTGFVHPDRVLTNSGARAGDVLLLTKPLGIGVLSTAHKWELASQEGIELAYDMGEGDLPLIPGDPERLKQVFCNVLDNAAKHGGAGRRITASVTREGEWQVVRIRDFGPGIPEAELPFVKQKFYKGTSKARGSGIGLAVCDEIVGLHGGDFTIANAAGGGTVVTIRLPGPK